MDDGVTAFMRAINDGFPAVETMSAPQARAAIAARRLPVENIDDVAAAEDRVIPGPGGDIPVRIYLPHGPREARPAVVFCHGGGFVLCDMDSHDSFCRAMARHTVRWWCRWTTGSRRNIGRRQPLRMYSPRSVG